MLSGSRPGTSGQAVFTDRGGYNRQGVETAKSGSSNKMPQIIQKDNIVPPIAIKQAKNDASGGLSSKGASARNQIGQPALKGSINDARLRPQTSGQNTGSAALGATGSINQTTQVWVTKWVDYSSKYGLGYLLSDLSAGVFFNDSTKVVAESSGTQFYYYERKAIAANEKQDVMSQYSFSNYPVELQKKVTLL